MELDDELRQWPAWPAWGLWILGASVFVFAAKMLPYPVPDAKYMGTQVMSPGATITIEIPTGVDTEAGAHVVRDPRVVVEVLEGSEWIPTPLQPTIVDTSGAPTTATPEPPTATTEPPATGPEPATTEPATATSRTEVTARIRFTLPDDPSLRGTQARLFVPLYVDFPAAAVPTWHRTYRREFVYATPEIEASITGWHQRRRQLRWGALAALIAGLGYWIVRRVRRTRGAAA